MNRTTVTTLMTSALVVSVVALAAAGGAVAQTNGNGGKGGGIGSTGGGGGGGGERVIVCTGCANPNAFIEDGVLKGDGYGGGTAAAPVVTHVPRTPNNPNRRRPPDAYQANEACYLKQDLLPDGRMVIYRDCGEVIRGYR
ncbi:hypothetical protein [Amorphus sp. MBR-141]